MATARMEKDPADFWLSSSSASNLGIIQPFSLASKLGSIGLPHEMAGSVQEKAWLFLVGCHDRLFLDNIRHKSRVCKDFVVASKWPHNSSIKPKHISQDKD